MRYLDERTPGAGIKLFEKYQDLKKEFVPSEFNGENDLLYLSEGLAKRYEGQKIVMLIDEIGKEGILENLGDIQIPQTVRLILIVNPVLSLSLSLPTSFAEVTLTKAFRSTRAITSLAQFIAKQEKAKKETGEGPYNTTEGDCGSDVQGTQPVFFDVDNDERKLDEALAQSRRLLGDDVTILHAGLTDSMKAKVNKYGKEGGGPWECNRAKDFYGWEADKVVAVTSGYSNMELITRAKTKLIFILACHEGYKERYHTTREHFQQAVALGLVDHKK